MPELPNLCACYEFTTLFGINYGIKKLKSLKKPIWRLPKKNFMLSIFI